MRNGELHAVPTSAKEVTTSALTSIQARTDLFMYLLLLFILILSYSSRCLWLSCVPGWEREQRLPSTAAFEPTRALASSACARCARAHSLFRNPLALACPRLARCASVPCGSMPLALLPAPVRAAPLPLRLVARWLSRWRGACACVARALRVRCVCVACALRARCVALRCVCSLCAQDKLQAGRFFGWVMRYKPDDPSTHQVRLTLTLTLTLTHAQSQMTHTHSHTAHSHTHTRAHSQSVRVLTPPPLRLAGWRLCCALGGRDAQDVAQPAADERRAGQREPRRAPSALTV
jgi:hypothetical protein